eukprot:gb/GEZN01004073.1/.p1 GENE.gb/GEZN01004073.1/~~gb/GEZN01004073.1/.p1  ORF type:complete len:602 (+),score=158.22 gb/GEZN01004073.1/:77-1807(+)
MVAPSVPGLPQKPKIKPNAKMKNLYWKVVNPRMIPDTVWMEVGELEASALDIPTLEAQFCKKERKEMKKGKDSEDEEGKKKKLVTLLDSKRSYAIGIGLSNFKGLSHVEIRDALLEMDYIVLTEPRLAALVNLAPTQDEQELVNSYGGAIDLLGAPEQFVKTLGQVPHLDERIKFALLQCQFPNLFKETEALVLLYEKGINTAKGSKPLLKVLQAVLAIGNFMNGGTRNGQAYGFEIELLSKLQNTTDLKNKLSLVHFLLNTLKKTDAPDTAEKLVAEFGLFEMAARIEEKYVKQEVDDLVREVKAVKKELMALPKTKGDKFHQVLSVFADNASRQTTLLEGRMEAMQTECSSLLLRLGVDRDKFLLDTVSIDQPATVLFNILHSFAREVKDAQEELETLEQEKAQKVRREESKLVREEKHKARIEKNKTLKLAKEEKGEKGDKATKPQLKAVEEMVEVESIEDFRIALKSRREKLNAQQVGKAGTRHSKRTLFLAVHAALAFSGTLDKAGGQRSKFVVPEAVRDGAMSPFMPIYKDLQHDDPVEFERRTRAVIVVQRRWRGYIARKKYAVVKAKA